MNNVIYNTLKKKDYVIKNYLIKVAHELSLELNDLLLLIYFMNQEQATLDLDSIKNDVYLTEEEAMQSYDRLLELNLIESQVIKNDRGLMDEVISTDNILKYVTNDIQRDIKRETKSNIFDEFQSEFGRTLSPMEYEVINGWLDMYDETMIHEALKEAVLSGAKSLRYITRILQAWKEKGYTKSPDVRKEENLDNTMVNLFTYDWLDDIDEQ
jgi:DNA replication protein